MARASSVAPWALALLAAAVSVGTATAQATATSTPSAAPTTRPEINTVGYSVAGVYLVVASLLTYLSLCCRNRNLARAVEEWDLPASASVRRAARRAPAPEPEAAPLEGLPAVLLPPSRSVTGAAHEEVDVEMPSLLLPPSRNVSPTGDNTDGTARSVPHGEHMEPTAMARRA